MWRFPSQFQTETLRNMEKIHEISEECFVEQPVNNVKKV